MNVTEAIKSKRAVRHFQTTPLSKDATTAILNAGRRAQSAKNIQPWRFIAVTDKFRLKELSKLGEWAGHLAGAALAVAIVTPHPDTRFSVMFDAGQAAAYMQLAAWEMGIGSCLATIYDPERARQILSFPEDYHIRIAISFGYPLDPSLLIAPPQKGGRLPYDETVHWETW